MAKTRSRDVVSKDAEYQFLTSQVQAFQHKGRESAAQFVGVYSAVVAGVSWAATQKELDAQQLLKISVLSNFIVVLFAALTILMIAENLRAWKGYREAQVRVLGVDEDGVPRAPKPRPVFASKEEIALIVGIVIASALFVVANPIGGALRPLHTDCSGQITQPLRP